MVSKHSNKKIWHGKMMSKGLEVAHIFVGLSGQK